MALSGKTALICGGAKNLGAQVALELASVGASLALHYNSEKTKASADKLSATLKDKHPDLRFRFYTGDLTSGGPVEKLFSDVLRDFGSIDIVVNTVGMVLKKPFVDITEKEIDTMLAINTKAAFLILQQGAKHVNDDGKLISLGSALLAAFTGYYAAYAGSKAPLEDFTRALCKELADRRVSVNTIAPGPMDTPFLYGQETDEAVVFLKSMGMGGRLTRVTDVAPLVRFLCTEGAWITGQTIFPNGGFSTR